MQATPRAVKISLASPGSTKPQVVGFWGVVGMSKPNVCFGLSPRPVTVTTRIITFLVGDPYKPSFAIVTGWGVDLNVC